MKALRIRNHFGECCGTILALAVLRGWLKQPKVQLFPSEAAPPSAMDPLEWMELDRPRGWSMQHGHRRRLMVAHGDDVRCRGRSTVKRTLASGMRWQLLEKNKSHKCHGGNQLVTTAGDDMRMINEGS